MVEAHPPTSLQNQCSPEALLEGLNFYIVCMKKCRHILKYIFLIPITYTFNFECPKLLHLKVSRSVIALLLNLAQFVHLFVPVGSVLQLKRVSLASISNGLC